MFTDKRDNNQSKPEQHSWRKTLREFLFGMVGMEFTQHAMEMRASIETLFMLSVVGDTIGVPIMPPYYSLRLLPYVVPQIETWKRRVLREKEFSDEHDYHLHGL
ncbi:MAG TPA: hypothetical protein VJ436_06575 [Anaerolineales bacterium]|nr:hypothetical protein [Anaerolineales bacterium]